MVFIYRFANMYTHIRTGCKAATNPELIPVTILPEKMKALKGTGEGVNHETPIMAHPTAYMPVDSIIEDANPRRPATNALMIDPTTFPMNSDGAIIL
jgi:hypothetical protein